MGIVLVILMAIRGTYFYFYWNLHRFHSLRQRGKILCVFGYLFNFLFVCVLRDISFIFIEIRTDLIASGRRGRFCVFSGTYFNFFWIQFLELLPFVHLACCKHVND